MSCLCLLSVDTFLCYMFFFRYRLFYNVLVTEKKTVYINGLHVLDILCYSVTSKTEWHKKYINILFSNQNDHWPNGTNLHLNHHITCLLNFQNICFVFVWNFSILYIYFFRLLFVHIYIELWIKIAHEMFSFGNQNDTTKAPVCWWEHVYMDLSVQPIRFDRLRCFFFYMIRLLSHFCINFEIVCDALALRTMFHSKKTALVYTYAIYILYLLNKLIRCFVTYLFGFTSFIRSKPNLVQNNRKKVNQSINARSIHLEDYNWKKEEI